MAAQPIPLSRPESDSKRFDARELSTRTIKRRTVEAVTWGFPAVNFDLMYQPLVRDAKGAINQGRTRWSPPSIRST